MLSSVCASGTHSLCHRCRSLCTLRTPPAFTRPVCSWRALLVPPLMQLVHSLHVSSLYPTRVLLARTTRTVNDAACALLARLDLLLDSWASGAHYSYRRYAACAAVSERLEPLLDPGSLAGTNCPADARACTVSKRLGSLLDPCSLAGTNYSANSTSTACAVSE